MELCIIASNYPDEKRHIHVFLENIVIKFVDAGIRCNVIAPQSSKNYYLNKNIRRELVSRRITPRGNSYMVYSPLYTVLPPVVIGKLYVADWIKDSFFRAVKKVYFTEKMQADAVYSHFIHAGTAAVRLAQELGVPSFIANGEADTCNSVRTLSPALVCRTLEQVSGIISVSTKNREEIRMLSGGNPSVMEKTVVIPNATDAERFHKKDRYECREKLGWDREKFVVAFTGSFIERKGIRKLSNVVDRFDDVYAAFIGVGELRPVCKNIIHCGRVPNAQMADYLNAADIFVLPTLAEGCCNAVVEAVCCGLPVVSSDRPFNYDILDESNSLLIDPLSEDDIYMAIKQLKDSKELRLRLSEGCLKKAQELSLDARVSKILEFINEKRN